MKIKREDLKDICPLSPMQEGMLFHARQAPESVAYTEQVAWRVRGALDWTAYAGAWGALYARHDALRSVFAFEKSREPLRLVLKEAAPDLRLDESLAGQPSDVQSRQLAAARAGERQARFDLAAGPLLRVRAYRLAADEHEVVLTWHHILLDGWSTHLLLDELFTIYRAAVRGETPSLPPVPSYAPYAEWLATRDRDGSLAYWRRLLDGYEAPVEIPRLKAGSGPYDLQRVVISLDEAATAAAREAASRAGATLSSLVQTAWGVVCGRYADTDDVVFGAVVSGRPPDVPGVERMAGLLINTIPVRVAWSAGETCSALLQRVQQQALDSQPHHASKLADVQAQSPLRADLVRHLVVFENYPVAPAAGGDAGVSLAVVESSEPTSYDLLLVADPGARLRLELQFNAAAYPADQVTAVAGHLERFLRNAVASPSTPVDAIEMLAEDERRALTSGCNQTDRAYPFDSLTEAFAAAAAAHAARPAIAGESPMTYADLDRRSNRLARHLVAAGVRPGDRVATLLERSPALIDTILAIVKAGAAYVPLDPETPADRVSFVLEDSGVRTVVAMTATQLRLPAVQRVAPDGDAAAIAAQSDAPLSIARARGDEAVLYYTSGSTGTPKAVCMPHRALMRLVLQTDFVQLGPSDHVAHVSNVAFDAASFEIWGALLNGATLHPIGREVALTPALLARELKARRITAMFLTTSLFNQVARDTPDAFATLDALLFGGETAEPAWVKRVLARGAPKRLINVYGPTETGTFATFHEVRAVTAGRTVPIGRPIANTTAFVVGRHGGVQPIGAAGELFIGGDGLALGYHNRPELTARAFVAHPVAAGRLYRTGDVVRRNIEGDLEFVGRRDAQVKLRGFRIEPGEVEAALKACAGVVDAFVTVHQDDTTGDRRLIGYLAAPAAPRSLELDVRNHLRRRLPSYMIPSSFVIVDAFPMTPNGKLDRAGLPSPTRSGMGFGRTFSAPSGELEAQLAAIWQATLGVAAVGRQDNFFELGGHSLTASTAVSRIRADLKVDVPIAAFFEAPTLEALATLVAGLRAAQPSTATPLTRVARETTTR